MLNELRDQVHPLKRTHILKTWPEYFQAIWDGEKKFEFRKNDRDFRKEDELELFEYDPETESGTGRSVLAKITYVLQGKMGVPEGYAILSIDTYRRRKL